MNCRPLQLLVIDDNPAFQRLIHEAFKNLSGPTRWMLTFVEDGEKAFTLLRDQAAPLQPDLILLDWNLPKFNGDVVLQRLKADTKLKSTPVLVLSSSSAKADIQSAYDSQANGFITKPLELDSLFRTVKAIVDFWTTVVLLPSFASHPS